MLNPKKLTKEQFVDLKNRFHNTIFDVAPRFGIWFDDKEVEYIETKMQTHKLYRLVTGKVAGIDCRDISALPLFKFQREWLLFFMNDPCIPIGVYAFIYYYIGHEQMAMKKHGSIPDRFLTQRWMEKCI